MRNIIFLGLLALGPVSGFASHGPCTDWERRGSNTCIFNGRSAQVWVRQCFHVWDLTEVCLDKDPNTLESDCSSWEKKGNVSCYNGNRWEQEWIRVCTNALLKTQFCSNSIDPNGMGN